VANPIARHVDCVERRDHRAGFDAITSFNTRVKDGAEGGWLKLRNGGSVVQGDPQRAVGRPLANALGNRRSTKDEHLGIALE